MTTYAFPSITPTEQTIGVRTNTRVFESVFTSAIQTLVRNGDHWRLRMLFRNLSGASRAEMIAFLVKLNGMEHRFQVQDHAYQRRGTLGGTPLVKGAGQTGSSLLIDGCTAGVTNWLRAGDQFQVGTELKVLTADVNSDGAGEVTLLFKPTLRTSPADNSAIITTTPKGLFMVANPNTEWSTGPGGNTMFSDFVIEAVEDTLQ